MATDETYKGGSTENKTIKNMTSVRSELQIKPGDREKKLDDLVNLVIKGFKMGPRERWLWPLEPEMEAKTEMQRLVNFNILWYLHKRHIHLSGLSDDHVVRGAVYTKQPKRDFIAEKEAPYLEWKHLTCKEAEQTLEDGRALERVLREKYFGKDGKGAWFSQLFPVKYEEAREELSALVYNRDIPLDRASPADRKYTLPPAVAKEMNRVLDGLRVEHKPYPFFTLVQLMHMYIRLSRVEETFAGYPSLLEVAARSNSNVVWVFFGGSRFRGEQLEIAMLTRFREIEGFEMRWPMRRSVSLNHPRGYPQIGEWWWEEFEEKPPKKHGGEKNKKPEQGMVSSCAGATRKVERK